MAHVKYVPDSDMPEETKQFGYDFTKGKSVEVTDERHLDKFEGNRFFEVSGRTKAANKGPDKSRADITDPEAEAAKDPTSNPLKAVHRGRGNYSIMRGDADELAEGLTKAEAEAFNAMNDDEKATELSTRRAQQGK